VVNDVLVVDDGSVDRTAKVAREVEAQVVKPSGQSRQRAGAQDRICDALEHGFDR